MLPCGVEQWEASCPCDVQQERARQQMAHEAVDWLYPVAAALVAAAVALLANDSVAWTPSLAQQVPAHTGSGCKRRSYFALMAVCEAVLHAFCMHERLPVTHVLGCDAVKSFRGNMLSAACRDVQLAQVAEWRAALWRLCHGGLAPAAAVSETLNPGQPAPDLEGLAFVALRLQRALLGLAAQLPEVAFDPQGEQRCNVLGCR